MRSLRARFVLIILGLITLGLCIADARQTSAPPTGYAVKKPIFGGSCPICPWGAMGDIVKAALKPYGWDIQVCYTCAGGPRAARMVADAMMIENATTDVASWCRALLQRKGLHEIAN